MRRFFYSAVGLLVLVTSARAEGETTISEAAAIGCKHYESLDALMVLNQSDQDLGRAISHRFLKLEECVVIDKGVSAAVLERRDLTRLEEKVRLRFSDQQELWFFSPPSPPPASETLQSTSFVCTDVEDLITIGLAESDEALNSLVAERLKDDRCFVFESGKKVITYHLMKNPRSDRKGTDHIRCVGLSPNEFFVDVCLWVFEVSFQTDSGL